MNVSSSPPVLYLGDDDDDNNNEQNQYFETNISLNRASSSTDKNLSSQKRKLTNANVRVNPSIVNWSKRQRNDHYQPQLSQNLIDSDLDSEPILLDPDEYIIEEPDSQSYSSFDWTIQSRPPSPPPPPLIPTKISSNSVQTISRVSTVTTSNVNNIVKRSTDKLDPISVTSSHDKFIQQQRKSIPVPPLPRPSLALLSLPLPKPPPAVARPNTQRGRPVKNSRIPNIQSTSSPPSLRQQPEQQIFPQKQQTFRPPPPPPPPLSTATTATTSQIKSSTSEIRLQVLNGTGIFSAFHDSKYYRCNICKFKSVTSSTLLQHLFTHMFFCEQCSFYTYSYYNLSQHIFEKHNLNLIEEINEPLNPKFFDLLYVTRCSDGTFALCMDSSSSPATTTTTTTNKVINNDQRLIISSATPNDQHQIKSPKKKIFKQKELLKEQDNDVVILPEKRDNNHRLLIDPKRKEKQNQTYVLMKHRRCYSMKKSSCLHSLTLEYNICREHTIRHMCQTQNIFKRRKFLTKFHNTRLIDEVASCLKTIVNTVVNSEENSGQSSVIYALPNHILNSILSTDNLNTLTSSLKLKNKYDQCLEQNKLYKDEHALRQSREHIFVLSSSETNPTEQSIISSLHSSMTNGDSIFTQTKVDKVPTTYDNTHRYLKGNLNTQPQVNNSNLKVQKKINTTQAPPPPPPPLPKDVPLRPVISKPSRPLSNPSVDRNNNSVASSKSKISTTSPSIIILD